MTSAMISTAPRLAPAAADQYPNVGPGSYQLQSSIKIAAPQFTAFTSSSNRDPFGLAKGSKNPNSVKSPSPMAYDVREKLIKKQPVCSSALNSGTKRFHQEQPWGPSKENWTEEKGIGNSFKKKSFSKQSNPVHIDRDRNVPSIPARHQAYGFEEDKKGKLVLQEPTYPGYSGLKHDTVGPMDYNPTYGLRSKKTTNFSKGSKRPDGLSKERLAAPGPGYYNTASSTFDDPTASSIYNDGSYTMKLNAARRQQSSSFESKTEREVVPRHILKEKRPAPGSYTLPSAISIKTKPAHLQNFGSSDARIKDAIPRSLRLNTAPGSYDPLTSDFDKNYRKTLKQNMLRAKSQWARSIAFNATGKKTAVFEPENIVKTTDATYYPKTTIADHIAKENPNGPFGSNTKRMTFPDASYQDPDVVAEVFGDSEAGNATFGHNEGKRAEKGYNSTGARMVLNKLIGATQPMSSFSYSKERFEDKIIQQGPPPGSYNVAPNWSLKAGVKMKPDPSLTKKAKATQDDYPMPGPGDYVLTSSFKPPRKNRKNIMISTGARIAPHMTSQTPSPGTYDPIPLYGNMITRSHNIMLSSKYN